MVGFLVALIYILITIGFFTAIQFERIQQEAEFNAFQLIVAIFWPFWLIWYLWTISREAYLRWKTNRGKN